MDAEGYLCLNVKKIKKKKEKNKIRIKYFLFLLLQNRMTLSLKSDK